MEGELQDWEVLQSTGSASEVDNSKSKSLDEIEDDSTQGLISFDHFSLETNNGVRRVDERSEEDGSVQSGSPGWIEPRSVAPSGLKHSSELWSDSSSDRVEDQRLVDDDDDVNNELGLEYSRRNDLGIVDIEESMAREKDWLDSSEEESVISGEIVSGNESVEGERKSVSVDPSVKPEKGLVWWKIPIEVLKYCVFKVNPIWSFSMAAAVVGFVMLGRRLYNMKKKSRTLQLKVLLDDKKVANHAARLNEAISIVKRVPIIRPALPSSVGMNQWSMMRV